MIDCTLSRSWPGPGRSLVLLPPRPLRLAASMLFWSKGAVIKIVYTAVFCCADSTFVSLDDSAESERYKHGKGEGEGFLMFCNKLQWRRKVIASRSRKLLDEKNIYPPLCFCRVYPFFFFFVFTCLLIFHPKRSSWSITFCKSNRCKRQSAIVLSFCWVSVFFPLCE